MATLGDRYELGEVLGVGGMARVVAARDRVLDREVAVKLIRDELVSDPTHRRRLLREARGAARLQHPNVVAIHDVSTDDDAPFIVMERVDGETLADVLRRDAPLPVDRAAAIVGGVLDGLAAAHARGLVHRDVKPANVLLTDDDTPKLADFGIARVLEDASTQLTTTGHVMGTPRYLAPEQAQGRSPGPAADVYAVGILAYECLAGRTPFGGDSAIAVALAHQQQPVPSLALVAPAVPAAVAAVVERALAKDPADRYADAAAMRTALQQAMDAPASAPGAATGAPLAATAPLPAPGSPAPTEALAPEPTAGGDGTTRVAEPAVPPTEGGRRRPPWVLAAILALVVAATALGLALRDTTGGPEVADGGPEADPDGTADEAGGDTEPEQDGGDTDPEPDDEPDQPADGDEPADQPDDVSSDLGDVQDLDDLVAWLERDPSTAGEKGPDLLDDARAVRDEADDVTRRTEARILVTELADWLASGELDREAGLVALDVLEPVGRPPDPRLEEANALFVDVARDLSAWGEDADTVLSGLEDLLELTAPGRITRDADELADELETRAADGTLDASRTTEAVAVLRRAAAR